MKDELKIQSYFISLTSSIQQAVACIDRNVSGIALVVDDQSKLLGTITDGDIRRAILRGTRLETPVQEILEIKQSSNYPTPITALLGTTNAELLVLMKRFSIRQIPLLNEAGQVVDLVTIESLYPREELPLQAVVMAGGFGTRLRPLTEELPKPMLPVGGRPIMEHVLDQLRAAGVCKVTITLHYKPEKVKSYFGDGHIFGLEIDYVHEEHPLGTAGALSLLKKPEVPILVVNGDILTQVDFRSMLRFHQKNNAEMTVCVRQYDMNVPYGVVRTEGTRIVGLQEKPSYSFLVNAGMYILNPPVLDMIPIDRRFDMTDLILQMMEQNRLLASFPIMEYWLDIGQHAEYERANREYRTNPEA